MSREQRQKLFNGIKETIIGLLLTANIFFLTEVYSDFKQMKADVQVIKQELASMRTAIDYINKFKF